MNAAEETPATAPAPPPDPATPWDRAVRTAIDKKPLLRAVLSNLRLVSVEGDTATLAANPGWSARAPKHLDEIAEFLSSEYARPMRAVLADGSAVATPDPGADADPSAPTPAAAPSTQPGVTDVSEHPMVKTALELFGGRIVDVQPRRPAP